jgi:hypothetical protein
MPPRPRAAAACSNSTSGAAAAPQESAAGLVWGLQPWSSAAPELRVLMSFAGSACGSVAVSGALQQAHPSQLHPDTLDKSALGVLLSKQLSARVAGVACVSGMLLSATFLPSQLDTMADLAGKLGARMQLLHGGGPAATLHVLLTKRYAATAEAAPGGDAGASEDEADELPHIAAALERELRATLQRVTHDDLQSARAAERALQQQLRLFDAATWASVLSQQLMSRKALRHQLAVRSLMGPAALSAARRLVEKSGLQWVELQPQQVRALAAAAAIAAPADTAPGSRRRPSSKRGSTAAAGAGADGDKAPVAAAGEGPPERVIVISSVPMSEEDAAGVPLSAFTDVPPMEAQPAAGAAAAGGEDSAAQAQGSKRGWPGSMFGL